MSCQCCRTKWHVTTRGGGERMEATALPFSSGLACIAAVGFAWMRDAPQLFYSLKHAGGPAMVFSLSGGWVRTLWSRPIPWCR